MKLKTWILLLFFSSCVLHVNAQLMKKLKEKVTEKVNEKVNDATDKLLKKNSETSTSPTESTSQGSPQNNSNANRSRPVNSKGAGLISTPPDIGMEIENSSTAFNASQFAQARYSIQQALLGTELLIGQELLKSLPTDVTGLPSIPSSDKVTSSGWGWSGFSVQREYQKDEKTLTVTVQDYAFYGAAWAMLLDSGMGGLQMGNEQQKSKRIMVDGNKAVISYDESSGYTIAMLLTQGTALVWEGVNFNNENELLNAVKTFDIKKIKALLGEK